MKRFLAAMAAACIVVAACAKTPQVIAHRGYWNTDGSAQNSIRSLVKADSIGCYGSEFDVWITADGVLVVNHNRDINGKDIESGNSADLLLETLPNGERMPSLSQYLDAAKDLKVELILEVKPHKDSAREDIAVPMIIDMVEAKGLTDRTTYITFSSNAYRLLVEQCNRPVYYLTAVEPDALKEMGGTGPDYNIGAFRKNPDWFRQFKDMGMPINVWTITKPQDLQYCIAHDVDFITTDIPEQAIAAIAEHSQPARLSVMSYNLHAGVDASIDSIAKDIIAANPDFVALQEVDAYTGRASAPLHNGKNMIAELAAATGMFPIYGRTLNFAGGYYGIGMLSKHPCLEARTVELPTKANVEPRALVEGLFEINGKKKVVFASTHLCVEDEPTRISQAQYIANRYAGCEYPVLLGGDFNSTPDSEPITAICAVLSNLSGIDPTFPVNAPTDKIDYIFGANGATAVSSQVIHPDGSAKSDHCPVTAIITIQ